MKHTVEIIDGVLTLPDEIIKQFDLHPGDEVQFNDLGDGTIEMKFPKKEEIEIELPDEDIFTLMKMAHEQNITFNQLVENILRKKLNEFEKRISIKYFEENFDLIIERVEKGMTFILCEDEELTLPKVMLVPYNKYMEKT